MQITETKIAGVFIIQPRVIEDHRGYFFESYNFDKAALHDLHHNWVQDNEAKSSFGVLRGLHYQARPMDQAKLVRVVVGKVQDVVVDIRPDSPTVGQHVSVILSGENKTQFLIPKGMAHGYLVLSDEAIFSYKCDELYSQEDEGGIKYNDPQLGIEWRIDPKDIIISEKDKKQPLFGDHKLY